MHRPSRKPVSQAGQKRVSAKISHLHKTEPGKPNKQIVAMVLNMERQRQLGPRGGYRSMPKR